MSSNADVYYQAVEDGSGTQRVSSVRIFKVGAAVIGGTCLVLLSIVGISSLQNTNASESTDLIGMPTSLRSSAMQGFRVPPTLASIPGPGPWKDLAVWSLEQANHCNRDVTANAMAKAKFDSIVANMGTEDRRVLATMKRKVVKKAKQIRGKSEAPYGLEAGMVGPVEGLWDPFKFSAQATQGELLFYREAEIKHGRVCMLAVLGFWVQEAYHPFFGGDIHDYPAIQSVGQPELALFWPALFIVLGIPELAALERIDYAAPGLGFTPELKPGVEPGDVGFDPLGFKPKDPEELLAMQNRELLHGRLAMISAAGAIAQEVLTQAKLTEGGIYTPVGEGIAGSLAEPTSALMNR